jgi:hypothetical protein
LVNFRPYFRQVFSFGALVAPFFARLQAIAAFRRKSRVDVAALFLKAIYQQCGVLLHPLTDA